MKLGLHISDFTWPNGPTKLGPDLARVAKTAEDVGFDLITVMDHVFQIRGVGPPEHEMLEAYTTLGYIAANTSKINLSVLVTAVVYRHPGMLAKQVTTLNVLSGGRAWLGIGAAWNEDEAKGLGLPFPERKVRFQMLEEALRICIQMWKGDETPFHGKHYQLERLLNAPQAITKPRPKIMIGGSGEQKTLKLVARYADACNMFGGPELAHKLDVLREHCKTEGRNYSSILKTSGTTINLGPNADDTGPAIDQLQKLAAMGFGLATVSVKDITNPKVWETIGAKIVPAVAKL